MKRAEKTVIWLTVTEMVLWVVSALLFFLGTREVGVFLYCLIWANVMFKCVSQILNMKTISRLENKKPETGYLLSREETIALLPDDEEIPVGVIFSNGLKQSMWKREEVVKRLREGNVVIELVSNPEGIALLVYDKGARCRQLVMIITWANEENLTAFRILYDI